MVSMLTQRQKEIFNKIVEEYIDSAQPVSSKLLERKFNFGICPATIRIEMQKLTDDGLVFQPHTSAGRVPTDEGYRFFVNDLLKGDFSKENAHLRTKDWIAEESNDTIKLLQSITKNLALLSSNLALGYLLNEKILWKDGWEEILLEPEFKETKLIVNFADLLKNFEDCLDEFEINSGIKIYIGKENPFSKTKEFSIILSRYHFPPADDEGILAILGPKRMCYSKNINLLNSLKEL